MAQQGVAGLPEVGGGPRDELTASGPGAWRTTAAPRHTRGIGTRGAEI